MRTYKFFYYAEVHDECYDFETYIEASNIDDALLIFRQGKIVCKRIHKIEEIPYKPRQ